MEKVTVQIGRTKSFCENRNDSTDREFLMKAFGISRLRAIKLIDSLCRSTSSGCNQRIELNLTYEQLGRYSAMRRTPVELGKYWCSATVREHVSCEPAPAINLTIELRPGWRNV